MAKYAASQVAELVVKYCLKNGIKVIYISGNGGSGKTTLSKLIGQSLSSFGTSNIIEMDDFVVDTKLRNSASASWVDVDSGEERNGKYTTSFEASYFLQNIKAILCNLIRGNNYWHWPKKGKVLEDSAVEYRADALLTIVEGISSVFLPKFVPTLTIFMECSKDVEIARRVQRARSENEKDLAAAEKSYEVRNSQFKANILPHACEFDIELHSDEDYGLVVKKDIMEVL